MSATDRVISILAFIFTFYILTFLMDLLPAVRTKHHYSEETVTEMGHSDSYMNGPHRGGDYTNGGYQNDGYTNGTHGYGVRDPALPASRNF